MPDKDSTPADTADQRADALQVAGVRDAAKLETAGVREADVLQTAGIRDAAALAAQGARDAATAQYEGQRAINLLWETTQMRVALSFTWGSLVAAIGLGVFGKWLGSPDLQLAAVVFLFGVANLVTGFYFGRTNHARTGGVTRGDEGR
jgi:hypothetical protein